VAELITARETSETTLIVLSQGVSVLKKPFLFGVLFLLTASLYAADKPRSLFPTTEQIEKLGADKEWGGLQSACKSALDLDSHPIADFSPAPHYGPTGVVAENKDAAGPSLRRDSLAVYDLALCAKISHDSQFSFKAEQILDGWAHTTKRIGTLQGEDAFNFYFPYALLGANLLTQETNWHSDDFSKFVKDIVVPANNSNKQNNHGNWGVLLLVSAGGYLHDDALIHRARDRWIELMRTQVAEDGTLPLEICRSDTSNWCGGPTKGIKGIAYTHYTLFPTTIAAEIFRNLGQDVYSGPEGNMLCEAYAKAAAWSLHPETFPYFSSNEGKLDGVHNIDYFYVLQNRCPTSDGFALLDEFGGTATDPFRLRAMYRPR
jgi:hypothetical protein